MNRTKIITSHVRHILKRAGEGQGLVELMIIMPLLLLFFIGVFEVGWALRGYLVLTNANREITRFAVRPGYVDYSNYNPAQPNATFGTIGYDNIASHLFTVLGRDPTDPAASPGQLPVELGQNSTLIISHIVADTGFPCRDMDPAKCDCSWFDDLNYRNNPNDNQYKVSGSSNLMLLDDAVIHPAQAGKGFHATTYPVSSTITTRLVYTSYAMELARQNDKFNCELLTKSSSAVPSANNVIVTELFYDQPQLIGFPGLSNSLTDPLPMYSQTTMRLAVGARGGSSDALGPLCDAMPFAVYTDTIKNRPANDRIDIFNGKRDVGGSPGPNNDVGWLQWDSTISSGAAATYLRDELTHARTAFNDFVDARADPPDTTLKVGSWVASLQGTNATVNNPPDHFVNDLVGKTIRVPVWDTYSQGTGGQENAYLISGFAWVRIESASEINLPAGGSNGNTVYATYLGDASDDCK